MTYVVFLAIFLLLPLIALALLLRRRLLDRRFLVASGALMAIALLYMAPWDHIAAVWGVWTWAPRLTLGIRWWNVPPEEYAFCLLETLLATTLTYAILTTRRRGPASSEESPSATLGEREEG